MSMPKKHPPFMNPGSTKTYPTQIVRSCEAHSSNRQVDCSSTEACHSWHKHMNICDKITIKIWVPCYDMIRC